MILGTGMGRWDEVRGWLPDVPGVPGTRSVQPVGLATPLPAATAPLPPGYTVQPFNCPAGSDFAASQEAGMCVGPDYSPIPRVLADGSRLYYALDGTVAGTEPGTGGADGTAGAAGAVQGSQFPAASHKDWITGVPNAVVLGVLGLVLVMRMAK